MNPAAVISAAEAARKAVKKGVNWKRTMIAKEELDAGKDLDCDGVIGGVGNRSRQRDLMRRREKERRTQRKRKILEQGGLDD
jgi:hypothetical protein